MEGVLRYATILLEAFDVPATVATFLVLMQGHVRVSELEKFEQDNFSYFVLLG